MPLVFLLAPTLTVAPWSLGVPGKYAPIVVEVDKIIGKGNLFLGAVALYVKTLTSTNISVCVMRFFGDSFEGLVKILS